VNWSFCTSAGALAGLVFHLDWRAAFHSSQYGSVFDAGSFRASNEALVSAQIINELPLARVQHLQRQKFKMPECP